MLSKTSQNSQPIISNSLPTLPKSTCSQISGIGDLDLIFPMLMSNEERDIQELLAPPSLQFFSKEGNRIGDKQSLEHQIHDITEIPVSALQGSALSQFSPSQKFDWAKNRRTTREEDWAYCLLGIFDVSMPILYGVGRHKAVSRLRREIREAFHGNEGDICMYLGQVCSRGFLGGAPPADHSYSIEGAARAFTDSQRCLIQLVCKTARAYLPL